MVLIKLGADMVGNWRVEEGTRELNAKGRRILVAQIAAKSDVAKLDRKIRSSLRYQKNRRRIGQLIRQAPRQP